MYIYIYIYICRHALFLVQACNLSAHAWIGLRAFVTVCCSLPDQFVEWRAAFAVVMEAWAWSLSSIGSFSECVSTLAPRSAPFRHPSHSRGRPIYTETVSNGPS